MYLLPPLAVSIILGNVKTSRTPAHTSSSYRLAVSNTFDSRNYTHFNAQRVHSQLHKILLHAALKNNSYTSFACSSIEEVCHFGRRHSRYLGKSISNKISLLNTLTCASRYDINLNCFTSFK
jgi:hypothetical protein